MLTTEDLEDDTLLFYFNADGENFNTPKDKSKNGRNGEWKTNSLTGNISQRTNIVANCMGCFNASNGNTPGFCVPSANNTGYCGDGIVMGNEECDGGEGCGDDCKCTKGYAPHGLPYCMKQESNACQWRDALNKCLPAMLGSCDCDCFNKTGIQCLLDLGCNADSIPFKLYTTWLPCVRKCPDNYACYRISK